ncbi:MAG: hypothetical protein ACHQNT_05440 [Bacteroidia bacterium]
MSILKSAFFILFFIYSFHVKAQTAQQVISKYIEFTGGEKQWKTVRSIKTSGIYNYGGKLFPFTSYSKAPDLYKVMVSLNEKYFAQAYDGKQGWKIDAFNNETKPTFLSGKYALAMMNEADVELESAFINYRKKGHEAILEGKDTVDSKTCFRIKFIRKDGDTTTYFFNSENFELVMKSAVSKNTEMNNAVLDTYYSDYREINGVKFPFSSISKLKEQTILAITIEKIEINVDIPDKEFQP